MTSAFKINEELGNVTATVTCGESVDTGLAAAFAEGNTTISAETSPKIILREPTPPPQTEPKLTAAQIARGPVRLHQIGREIRERLKKAKKQNELAENHLIAVNELIAEARELCDRGDFKRFRRLYCPHLGQSQAYALRAIGAGKKTFAEHRVEERERKQRTRASQRAAAANSGTVPENSNPQTEVPAAATEDGEPATTTIAPAPGGPVKPLSGVTPNDMVSGFNSHVMELKRKISKHKVERFAATAVPADDLAKLGKFLTDLAILKKSDDTTTPRRMPALPSNGLVSTGGAT
jgi:hypothetical protein